MNVHMDIRPFSCDVCQMTFKSSSHLKKHQQVHTVTGSDHKCSTCEKAFRTPELLKSHEKTHYAEKIFGCEDCEKYFSRLSYLKTHIKSVHEAEKIPCPQCRNFFSQPEILRRHIDKSHKRDEKILHVCAVCGKAFKSKLNLIKHKKAHTAMPFSDSGGVD